MVDVAPSPPGTAWLFDTARPDDRARLAAGRHHDPHRVLGIHPVQGGVVVRAMHPEAVAVAARIDGGATVPLRAEGDGVFAGYVAGADPTLRYRLAYRFSHGGAWECDDPYRVRPTLGDVDLHLLSEGTHHQLWRALGARELVVDGVRGVRFAVWAPNAQRVSVVGDFCHWDGRVYPMRSLGRSGVYELFVPGLSAGALYKYELLTPGGDLLRKADPVALAMEAPPGTASRVFTSAHAWRDGEWMARRAAGERAAEPMAIYEVHLGSWARPGRGGRRPPSYREIAPLLAGHAKRFGFTHVELLPIAEHPFTASWGYQVSGYYAPTARHGSPDDFRYLVDYLHQCGVGVILDWVPGHFPKDDFGLARFDGTALYEHEDPRRGEHPDWGTAVFNFGRREVRNFLTANALYWLEEFHLDGLRVDAVASMLYLDYSRREGQWLPNAFGGREDLDAIAFLRETTGAVARRHPDCFTVAEESTAWPGVSHPVHEGGLGFTFKWNMGWMHDTLEYFKKEPVHRKHHHDMLTFSMLYEHTERFIMPLSHDEVVHGKRSLLGKMPGDRWQRFANLRALLVYQYTRPGKKLLFMGTELAPDREWHHDHPLDWGLAADPRRAALQRFLEDLGRLYLATPALWRGDGSHTGFSWIDCNDREHSVYCYQRRDGADHVIVVLNLTPVPRYDYRVGAPGSGRYVEVLSSDDPRYGGSEVQTRPEAWTEPVPWHGFPRSVRLHLPPLGALVLAPAPP